jgi:hypothetical protein
MIDRPPSIFAEPPFALHTIIHMNIIIIIIKKNSTTHRSKPDAGVLGHGRPNLLMSLCARQQSLLRGSVW